MKIMMIIVMLINRGPLNVKPIIVKPIINTLKGIKKYHEIIPSGVVGRFYCRNLSGKGRQFLGWTTISKAPQNHHTPSTPRQRDPKKHSSISSTSSTPPKPKKPRTEYLQPHIVKSGPFSPAAGPWLCEKKINKNSLNKPFNQLYNFFFFLAVFWWVSFFEDPLFAVCSLPAVLLFTHSSHDCEQSHTVSKPFFFCFVFHQIHPMLYSSICLTPSEGYFSLIFHHRSIQLHTPFFI